MKLHHIGIEVRDLYRMELFYKKVFGLKTAYRYISLNQPGLRTAVLENGDFRMELLERPTNGDIKTELRQNRFHLSLETKDTEMEYGRLKNMGLEPTPPRVSGDGFREFMIKDPEENIIEISLRTHTPPEYPIRGVIFDLDGTLIDSEENYYRADQILLSEYGINFTKEDKTKYIGTGNKKMMQDLQKDYNLPDSPEVLLKKKNAVYLDLALKHTPVYPEMLRFVKLLQKAGYPMAVASGSSPVILEQLMSKLGLSEYFAAVVSAEEVAHSKPAPDIFIETANRLGIDPAGLSVVEDSQYGVEAAKRAFMQCIAVPYLSDKPLQDSFLMADLLFPNGMKEFKAARAFNWVQSKKA